MLSLKANSLHAQMLNIIVAIFHRRNIRPETKCVPHFHSNEYDKAIRRLSWQCICEFYAFPDSEILIR